MVLENISSKVLMVLLLLPFEETFKVDSKLWIYKVNVPSCEYNIHEHTKFHEDINKHELVIKGKKYQLVGTIC